MTLENFWNDKNILITGHSGFKGMWMTLVLKNFNAYVTGISRTGKGSNVYNLLDSNKFFEDEYFFDLSENLTQENKEIFAKKKFDIIFHFAAQSLVSIAAKDPVRTLKTNVLGTYNVIDTVLNNETSNCMVISTTDKVYKNSEDLNNEESKLGGSEFYSSSKVAQEMVIESFKNSTHNRKLNLSTVRSGNVLGPGDGASDRLMTDLIKSLKDEEDIILRNPNSIRPWQDIMDSIYGYLLVAKESYTSNTEDIFNLNTEINNEVTTKEIAEKAIQKWNSNINIVESKEMNFYEASKLRLDSSKAKSILGWKSKLNIDITLDKIVEWEKSNDQDEREKVSFNQIDDYFRA